MRRAGGRAALLPVVAMLLAGPAASTAGAQDAVSGAPSRVVLRGDPGLAGLGSALLAAPSVWKPFPGIGTLPDVGIDTLELWVTSDLGSGPPADLRRPEPWVAGTADPSARRIALRTGPGLGGPGGLRTVLRHELAHLAVEAATGGNYPRWLTEGYAQYASGEWSLEDAWQLQAAFLRRGATTLEQIDLRFRRHPVEARIGYLLSYTAVNELASLGGEAGLAAVFRRLKEGESFADALRGTYGITEDAFEARWRKSLVDRYGWLYVLSRAGLFWLGVTGLVLFVALRRSRRDRRRLEALRAGEASTADTPPGSPRPD